MKNLKKVLIVLLAVVSINTIKAQDVNHPWEVDLGANAVVFYPMANYSTPSFNNYLGGFKNISQHYNYYGTPVRFHIGRFVAKGFSIGMAASANKIRKMGGHIKELDYFGIDADLRYALRGILGDINIIKNLEIDPYISTGIGYTTVGSGHNGSLNFAGGINFWMGKKNNVGIQIQTIYKKNLTGAITSYFQHSIGVAYRFGRKDTDGDGIKDSADKCPDVVGLKKYNGCPDTDGDGIIDSADKCPKVTGLKEMEGCPDTDRDGTSDNKDKCPNVPGMKVNQGCPDSDGDGILDKNDKCPKVSGTRVNKGCPDTDGDGIIDEYDECPNMAGPAANKGCPWPDTDGDGVINKDDKCINIVGMASNKGCPNEVVLSQGNLKSYVMTIHFVSNHTTFNSGLTSKLNAIVSVMKNFNKTKFSIWGYTDSKGSSKYNQWLSVKRAKTTKKYLINHGINANRLVTKGFGESNPVDSNNTEEGRKNNRRVEIKFLNK